MLINGDGGYFYINFGMNNTNGTVTGTATPGLNLIFGASGGAQLGAFEADIPLYSVVGKSQQSVTSFGNGGGSGTECYTFQGGGYYQTGSAELAVTSLVIVNPNGNFSAGSVISLYGIEG